MKKLLLFAIFLYSSSLINAQCTYAYQFPAASVAVDNSGPNTVQIATCNFTEENSHLTGLVSGNDYEFTCNIDGTEKYVTIRDEADTELAHGPTPFTWNSTITGNIRAHWSDDAACAITASCHTTTVTCTSCVAVCTPATVINPTIDFTDCPASTTIGFEVSDMGSATSLTVTNDAGGTDPPAITSTGTYSITDLPATGTVTITLTPDDNPVCIVTLGPYTLGCPPENDDCVDAYPYSDDFTMFGEGGCVGTPNMIDLTYANNDDASDAPSCDGFGNDGVWYTWTATSLGLTFTSGAGAPGLVVFEAGTCGSLVEVGCLNNASGSVGGLTIGNDYIIYIYDDSNGTVVDFCLEENTPPAAPANDDCAGAISLPGNDCTSSEAGLTTSATQSLTGCVGTADDDIWYSFQATATEHIINITNTSESADIVTEVFDACGGTSLVCQDYPNSPVQVTGLTIGNTYVFRIYAYFSGSTTGFDVCVEEVPPPPSNDACGDAIPITLNNAVQGNTDFATNIEALAACDGGGGGPNCSDGGTGTNDFTVGVWYVYTSMGPETITVDLDGTDFDAEVQVFSGDCGSLICVGGDDDGGPNGDPIFCFESTASFAPVDYYIYVDGHGAATGNYDMVIASVLPIEIISFEAKTTLNGNKILWSTATEVNNDYQAVEKSRDGISDWTLVDKVITKGDSKKLKSYELLDREPYGLTYYRLRSVDLDGTEQYSEVVSVERKIDTKKMAVYPNPTVDDVSIELSLIEQTNVNLILTDISGKVIANHSVVGTEGINIIPLGFDGLQNGVYILTLQTPQETFVERIFKN